MGAYQIDDVSKKIISLLYVDNLINKRKANYNILAENLKNCNRIKSIFVDINEDVCPTFYPVYIYSIRNDVRKKLIDEKIYCPVHWPIPDMIDIDKCKTAFKVYSTVLSIPCDQRYEKHDMERIFSVLKCFD